MSYIFAKFKAFKIASIKIFSDSAKYGQELNCLNSIKNEKYEPLKVAYIYTKIKNHTQSPAHTHTHTCTHTQHMHTKTAHAHVQSLASRCVPLTLHISCVCTYKIQVCISMAISISLTHRHIQTRMGHSHGQHNIPTSTSCSHTLRPLLPWPHTPSNPRSLTH